MIVNALADQKVSVCEDNLNVDRIHVDDHCRALMAVLLEGRTGEVYNVGANTKLRNSEIAELVMERLGKPRLNLARPRTQAIEDAQSIRQRSGRTLIGSRCGPRAKAWPKQSIGALKIATGGSVGRGSDERA